MVVWYADERVVVKPYDDGDLVVICTNNRVETNKIGRAYNSFQLLQCRLVVIYF